jgi:hypothetical protein
VKVAFHSSYLGYRGTEIALMDYAWGNREVLGHEAFFLMPWREGGEQHPVVGKMKEFAPLRFYRSADEREGILREERADLFYCIKNGWNDGVFSRRVPTGIHAIFRESEFHGDIYAYVSSWLSAVMACGKAEWVPHMVRLEEVNGELRDELGISPEATVFGRHGGEDSFDISWVQQAVVEIAKKNPRIFFLFLNTRPFGGTSGLPNIRFLPATADPILKRKFLNTCDAMLHARQRGETFGLSCLEFAMLGKLVLTYGASPERAHLEILGDLAVPYQGAEELKKLIGEGRWVEGWKGLGGLRVERPIGQKAKKQYPKNTGSRFSDYSPDRVMERFRRVFLDPVSSSVPRRG